MTPPIYAVIPTHDRPADLADCIAAVRDQVHHVIVIDNASDPAVPIDAADTVIRHAAQPPNISELWNIGILAADRHAMLNRAVADVLILNDDVICGPGLAEGLQNALRATGCDIASPGPVAAEFHEPGPVQMATRMTGYCWMLRAESDLIVDEAMQWWYSDDDVAQQACAAGGRLVVPGLALEHRHPDQSTHTNPALAEQAAKDRATFVAKWGFEPW